MLDLLINYLCDQLDALRILLPVPSINLAGLGGTSNQILLPVDSGGFRAANVSPLGAVADLISRSSWLVPLDQIILALTFIAGWYLTLHSFRAIRWLIQLVRGSGS